MSLFSNKLFLNYLTITLLKQHINALKLLTLKEKLIVII